MCTLDFCLTLIRASISTPPPEARNVVTESTTDNDAAKRIPTVSYTLIKSVNNLKCNLM